MVSSPRSIGRAASYRTVVIVTNQYGKVLGGRSKPAGSGWNPRLAKKIWSEEMGKRLRSRETVVIRAHRR